MKALYAYTPESGTLYQQQLDAITAVLKKPSLNKSVGTRKRNRVQTQQPAADASIKTRIRHLNCFMGFCINWQGCQASMEPLTDTILIAKYIGFHIARGNTLTTIQQHVFCIKDTVGTIFPQLKCPGVPKLTSMQLQKYLEWTSNVIYRCRSEVAGQPKAEAGCTLWEVWEHTKAENSKLQGIIEVRHECQCCQSCMPA